MDVVERMKIYRERLEQFKREMAEIGVKVKVTASFGKWTSTVEKEGA
ncbi:MAG: hypothetical protein HWN51_04080 [Desulfobacterales bacterium]|nr:hypothetical protein [Desulfobacterales bacterium]